MKSALRIGTALAALAISAALTGCAVGKHKPQMASKAEASNVGLATRALGALASKDYATAVDLAERAVEAKPGEPNFRMLLGNAYFASGRFASAEAAYRDSLALNSDQPQLVLKLALAQIAQGRNAAAMGALESARGSLDPADYGLAVALAGYPTEAVAVLDRAARSPGADSRVRQNLAVAYALSGDWGMARTVAAQDLRADQVEARVEQWMAMATPTHPSEQIAALTGIKAVADPGQPERLVLVKSPQTSAYAEAAPPRVMELPRTMVAAAPVPAPLAISLPMAEPEPMPSLQAEAVAPAIAPLPEAEAEPVAAKVITALVASDADPIAPLPTSFDAPQPSRKVLAAVVPQKAAATRGAGRSTSVVQIGAYSSPDRVEAAWNQLSSRYPSLNRYRPVSARFDGPKGTVYRLAVKGFASSKEAQQVCGVLQQKGKNCFVRRVAGDSPVQFASR